MRFVTVRELRSRSAEVWRRLADRAGHGDYVQWTARGDSIGRGV